ncbi:MAG: CAP domain-containing protein [Kineosporiaceae bacterium]|nr:CAP domain-containing protein [Kineosporiaceae bacterium]
MVRHSTRSRQRPRWLAAAVVTVMAALGGGATALFLRSLDADPSGTQVVTASDQVVATESAASGAATAAAVDTGAVITPSPISPPARVPTRTPAATAVGSAAAQAGRPSPNPTSVRSGAAAGVITTPAAGGVRETDGTTSDAATASRTAAPAPPAATNSPDIKWREEFVAELNLRRIALGLPPVGYSRPLSNQAASCSRTSLIAGTLQHCGHEVLWGGPAAGHTVQDILDAWFTSPGHRTALTYASSTSAGGAFVWRNGRAVAAITIDY